MLNITHRRCNNNSTVTASVPPADWTDVWVWILLTPTETLKPCTALLLYGSLCSAPEKESKSSGWQNREDRHRKGKERWRLRTIFIVASLEFWIRAASFVWRSIIFVWNLPSIGNNRRVMAGSLTMLNSVLLDLLFPLPNKKDRSGSSYVPYPATNQRSLHSTRTVLIRILRNIIITAVRFQSMCLI